MGWLDVLNLGVDIVQTLQLSKIKGQVGAMQQGALSESVMREIISTLKNAVFSVNKDLKVIQSKINEYPKQTYVISQVLDWRIQYFGISPEIFPELPDKDYAQNVIQGINETKYLSSQLLDAETLEKADMISKRIIELPQLDEWMDIVTKRDKISSLETEINALKSKNNLFSWLGAASVVIGVILFCPTLTNPSGGGATIFSFLFIGLGIVFTLFGKKGDQKIKTEELNNLKSTLPDQEKIRELRNTFSNLSFSEAQRKKKESISMIREFMGEFQGLETSKFLGE